MDAQFVVVVGLGNPGPRYSGTRHNIGFAVVDALRAISGAEDIPSVMSGARNVADRAISGSLDRTGWNDKGDFLESSATLAGWNAVLIKPQTFMNRSGEPLRSYLSFKKIPITKVIVVHDEIDLPVGSLRVKVGGGEGGHNGLRSISTCCGGKDYARVRAGVGKPAPGSPLALAPDGVATWVLSRFANDEATVVHHLVGQAAAAVVSLATQGLEKAQRTYNR